MGKVSNVSAVASAVTGAGQSRAERCRFLLNLISKNEFLFGESCFLGLQLQVLTLFPAV